MKKQNKGYYTVQGHRGRYQLIESPYATFTDNLPLRSYRSLLFKFWTLCVFEPPFGATYGQRTMFTFGSLESAYVDFLLVLIEFFSLGLTAEALRAIICSKPTISLRGPADPKFQEGVAPTNHSYSQKTRLNILSYGIKILTDFSSVVTIHAFDGQNSHR